MAGTGSGFGWTSAGRRLIGKTVLWLTGSCAATFVSMEIARWTQAALRTWLIATMGTVFLSTVVGAQAPVRGDSSSQRTEIIKVADTYRMAILSGDAQRAAAVYADDGAELPPGQPLVRGPAAIEEHLRGLFAGAKVTAFTFSHLDTTVEGNVAYDAGKYEQQLTLPSGQVLADVGKYLVVLKRTPGGWKAAFVMYNSDSRHRRVRRTDRRNVGSPSRTARWPCPHRRRYHARWGQGGSRARMQGASLGTTRD